MHAEEMSEPLYVIYKTTLQEGSLPTKKKDDWVVSIFQEGFRSKKSASTSMVTTDQSSDFQSREGEKKVNLIIRKNILGHVENLNLLSNDHLTGG